MTCFELALAKFALREHEKELAIWELQGLFPDAPIDQSNGKVLLKTDDNQAAAKLKKLAFFSCFRSDDKWTPTFQSEVELADSKNQSSRNIRYFAHSLHEYKGRFYPQLCKALMNAVGGGEGTALDPFSGCGTLLLEAALNDAAAIGVDINPVGMMIAKGKIASLKLNETIADRMRDVFSVNGSIQIREDVIDGRDIKYLRRWFPEDNLSQLIELDRKINAEFSGDALLFLRVVLSEILKPLSWQVPTEQRIRRRRDAPPANVHEFFRERLFFHLNKSAKLRQTHAISSISVDARLGDARHLPIESSSIDFVVTSPPYATALPYIDADRLSLYFFAFVDRTKFSELEQGSIGNREISNRKRQEWENRIAQYAVNGELPAEITDFLIEIRDRNKAADVGFRRKNTAALLCKYFIDMRASLREIHRVLKSGSKIALVVGDNYTIAGDKRMEIPTAQFLNLIAEKNGFSLLRTVSSAPPTPYNIYSKNASKMETISVLRR